MTTNEKKRGRPVGSGVGRKDATLRNMQAIIDFVRDFHNTHPYAPTMKEIAVGIGKTENYYYNVQPMVKELIAQGFLTNAGRYRGRSIAPTKKRVFYKPGD